MQKIPTLFVRDESERRYVTREVNPAAKWVIDGEGRATRKYDGTCVMLDENGDWWARREVKPGRAAPPNYRPISTDEVTGKTMGWEPVEQSPFAKFWREVDQGDDGTPGTYELIGPKVNGNPERQERHVLVAHDQAAQILDVPLDYDGLAALLTAEWFDFEGIVWHHPDGRMAKLKRRDIRPEA